MHVHKSAFRRKFHLPSCAHDSNTALKLWVWSSKESHIFKAALFPGYEESGCRLITLEDEAHSSTQASTHWQNTRCTGGCFIFSFTHQGGDSSLNTSVCSKISSHSLPDFHQLFFYPQKSVPKSRANWRLRSNDLTEFCLLNKWQTQTELNRGQLSKRLESGTCV